MFDQWATGGDDCLFTAHGGIKDGGMRMIPGTELRSNPFWGLTEAQLQSLVPHVKIDGTTGKLLFRPKQVVFSGEIIAAQIEGLMGQYFTQDGMGCAHDGLWCSHRRGRVVIGSDPLFRWSSAGHVDCDFGNCPSKSSRRSSPWVEVRGSTVGEPRLDIDLEVSMVKGGIDVGDCEKFNGKTKCGTDYSTKAYGSVEASMTFPCKETAHVQLVNPVPPNQGGGEGPFDGAPGGLKNPDHNPPPPPGGPVGDKKDPGGGAGGDDADDEEDDELGPDPPVVLELPYCDTVDTATTRCFRKTSAIQNGSTRGVVDCPAGDTFEDCGGEADIIDTTYGIAVELSEPSFDAEGGLYKHLVDAFCFLPNLVVDGDACSADSFFTKQLRKNLQSSLLDKLALDPSNGAVSLSGYEGCPAVTTTETGSLIIRLDTLDRCPPGNHNPDCEQLGGWVTGSGGSSESGGMLGGGGYLESADPNDPASPFEVELYEDDDDEDQGQKLVQSNGLQQREWEDNSGGVRRTAVSQRSGSYAVEEADGDLEAPATVGTILANPGTARLQMSEIDDALKLFCALGVSCDSLDFKELPLTQLATFDPSSLDELTVDPADSMSVQAASNEVDFLLSNAEFRSACLAKFDPALNPATEPDSFVNQLVLLQALLGWSLSLFQPVWNGACQSTPTFESMFPIMGLQLIITTAEGNLGDGFAFVNFQPTDMASEATHNSHNCYHRQWDGLPAADAPKCTASGNVEGMGTLDCGEVPGGPCVDMTADYYYDGFGAGTEGGFDLYRSGLHPNGDYSWRHRCFNDHQTGAPMVCNADFFPGAGQNEWPVCKICGIPSGDDNPYHFTMNGCEPVGMECPQDHALGTDGKCWNVYDGRPDWECQVDCKGLYGSYGYCMHSGNWLAEMSDKYWVFGEVDLIEPDVPYGDPICADWSCDYDGVQCAWRSEACGHDECVAECSIDSDCQDVDPTPGYPNGFHCTNDMTCRVW